MKKATAILDGGTCIIALDEMAEHDGIMEQVNFEQTGDNGYPGSLKLADMSWKYVESYRRYGW